MIQTYKLVILIRNTLMSIILLVLLWSSTMNKKWKFSIFINFIFGTLATPIFSEIDKFLLQY